MNILAVSDIHGNRRAYKNLAYRARKSDIDVLILAGDLTNYGDTRQEEDFKNILKSTKKIVLFLMGNDDENEWRTEENIVNINQDKIIYKGISFVGYQYSNPFVGGLFEKIEEEQKKDLSKLSDIVDNKTIFISHGPCYKILDKTSSSIHVGSKPLLDFIKKTLPKIHIFGHIHESQGVYKNFFNVSYPAEKFATKINYETLEYEFIKI